MRASFIQHDGVYRLYQIHGGAAADQRGGRTAYRHQTEAIAIAIDGNLDSGCVLVIQLRT